MKIKGKFTEDEEEELERALTDMNDPYAFENYCENCDLYRTQECPLIDKVGPNTRWKDIGCKEFID